MYEPLSEWTDREQARTRSGYVIILIPEHPRSFGPGWVYEHRLVMEHFYGRLLDTHETVHHISQQKDDNRLVNLFVCTEFEHRKAHDRCHVV